VILADGPEEVKAMYAARRKHFMEMLEADSPQARDDRFQRMMNVNEQFISLAQDMIRCNPNICD
jgi:hypothetical protein